MSTRTSLCIMVLILICAAIPTGYFFFMRPAAAPQIARHDADRDIITGRIVISDQTGCRERGFNNYNGQSVEKGTIQCSSLVPRSQGLPERLDTIRRAFAPQ